MFRRHWSGLPKDPIFPSTLEGLGYFINEDDEIRSIERPDCYFKYLIDRNERINRRQRFHFNLAMEDVTLQRLEDEGMQRLALPLGTSSDQPHVPVFVSPDIALKERVVLIVTDTTQSLGMLSGRVAAGPGGLTKGTAISLIRTIKHHLPDAGIVLANPGAPHWWPQGKRSISAFQADAAPLSSLVSFGRRMNEAVNRVEGQASEMEHLSGVFEMMERREVRISVLGVEKGAELVERFLDGKQAWERWGEKLEGMVLFGTYLDADWMHNEAFKAFLAKRCRAYALSSEPLDTPLSTPRGNPDISFPALGLPVYSSSEDTCSELIAIKAQKASVAYLAEVARCEDYANPEVVPVVRENLGIVGEEEEQGGRSAWDQVREEDKPVVEVVDESVLRELRMWDRWEETGEAEEDWGAKEDGEVRGAAPAA
ncbi:hypothetical protein NLU13_2352 [Sarocladium strictum]|uniref:Arb2 domain-containing protein n=1 Tax=Sarocladium strictum TaxID=5046 RepID=A0AA39GSN5_SARSR|nr:hypothetical protein NLU13_2352 [Sarocladium strictum]